MQFEILKPSDPVRRPHWRFRSQKLIVPVQCTSSAGLIVIPVRVTVHESKILPYISDNIILGIFLIRNSNQITNIWSITGISNICYLLF